MLETWRVFFVCLFSIVTISFGLGLTLSSDKILPTVYKISGSIGTNQHVNNICPSILLFWSEFYHLRPFAAVFCVYERFQLTTWQLLHAGRRTTNPHGTIPSRSWEDSTSKLLQVVQIMRGHTSEKHYRVMAARHEVLCRFAQLLWQCSQLLPQRH